MCIAWFVPSIGVKSSKNGTIPTHRIHHFPANFIYISPSIFSCFSTQYFGSRLTKQSRNLTTPHRRRFRSDGSRSPSRGRPNVAVGILPQSHPRHVDFRGQVIVPHLLKKQSTQHNNTFACFSLRFTRIFCIQNSAYNSTCTTRACTYNRKKMFFKRPRQTKQQSSIFGSWLREKRVGRIPQNGITPPSIIPLLAVLLLLVYAHENEPHRCILRLVLARKNITSVISTKTRVNPPIDERGRVQPLMLLVYVPSIRWRETPFVHQVLTWSINKCSDTSVSIFDSYYVAV